jgi:hypothetical protein
VIAQVLPDMQPAPEVDIHLHVRNAIQLNVCRCRLQFIHQRDTATIRSEAAHLLSMSGEAAIFPRCGSGWLVSSVVITTSRCCGIQRNR